MSYALLLDIKRCSGCQACAVACMDQNDLVAKHPEEARRQIFKIEKGCFPDARIFYLSLSCMHCQDAPCVQGCPTGSLYKSLSTGIVDFKPELCIGCHSCSLACPFGIPRFDARGKMVKCDLCKERVNNGLEPACVHTCPTKALKFGDINELSQECEQNATVRILSHV